VIGFIAGAKSDQLVVETEKGRQAVRDRRRSQARKSKGKAAAKGHKSSSGRSSSWWVLPVKIQPLAQREGGQGH